MQTHPAMPRRKGDVLGALGQRSDAQTRHQALPQMQISATTPRTHLIYCLSPRPRGSWHVPGEPHQGGHLGTAPRAGLPSRGCCRFPFLTLLEKIKNERTSLWLCKSLFALIPFHKYTLPVVPIRYTQSKRGKICVKWHFCARIHSPRCPTPAPELPAGLLFPVWTRFSFKTTFGRFPHTSRGRGRAQRDEPWGWGQRCGHCLCLPRCPLVPTRLVATGEDGSAPSTEPLQSLAHGNASPRARGLG